MAAVIGLGLSLLGRLGYRSGQAGGGSADPGGAKLFQDGTAFEFQDGTAFNFQ